MFIFQFLYSNTTVYILVMNLNINLLPLSFSPGNSGGDDIIPDEHQPPVSVRSSVQWFSPDEALPGRLSQHDRNDGARLAPSARQPGQPVQSQQQHPGLSTGPGWARRSNLPGRVLQLRAHVQQLLRQAGPGHGRQPPVLQVRNFGPAVGG